MRILNPLAAVPLLACLALGSAFAESRSASPYALRGGERSERIAVPAPVPRSPQAAPPAEDFENEGVDRGTALITASIGGIALLSGVFFLKAMERRSQRAVEEALSPFAPPDGAR